MNRVKEIREARGISLKELARRVNIMPLHLQRLENFGWDRSPWGLGTDQRIARALGVSLQEAFPWYAPAKPKKEEPTRPDDRTEEEIAETLRVLNERKQAKIVGEREIYDKMGEVEAEVWCPGVVCGPGARKYDFREQKAKEGKGNRF